MTDMPGKNGPRHTDAGQDVPDDRARPVSRTGRLHRWLVYGGACVFLAVSVVALIVRKPIVILTARLPVVFVGALFGNFYTLTVLALFITAVIRKLRGGEKQ